MGGLKALFHIDEIEKWDLLLANVKNLLDSTDDQAIIEVIANSKGVLGLKKDFKLDYIIEKQYNRGVRFVACNNSLKVIGISKEEILPIVEIIEAGVKEIIEKQQEGYGYIKP